MFIRIIDYVANPGGGVRFVVEAVAALAALPEYPRIEFVSDGRAFAIYEKAFRERCPAVAMRRVRPSNNPRIEHRWYHRLPGMTIVPVLLRGGDRASLLERFDIPVSLTRDADAVWLPWIHSHRLTGGHDRVVATYHDTIGVEFPGILPPDARKRAISLESEWCQSEAIISVTANATAAALERLYDVRRDRFPVIRLSAIHTQPAETAENLHGDSPWQSQPYLLCPANTSKHKNHEILLTGYALWNSAMPLVLTGSGTDFLTSAFLSPRATELQALATRLRLDDKRIVGLGYVSDQRYWSLLKSSHALVMPTLAEGGGSFPVLVANAAGIPVICSDIPIMREATAFFGGCPIWFDPHDTQSLARALTTLENDYDSWRLTSSARLTASARSWTDVAADYSAMFRKVASRSGASS